MGCDDAHPRQRPLSLGRFNTAEQTETAVETVTGAVAALRAGPTAFP